MLEKGGPTSLCLKMAAERDQFSRGSGGTNCSVHAQLHAYGKMPTLSGGAGALEIGSCNADIIRSEIETFLPSPVFWTPKIKVMAR